MLRDMIFCFNCNIQISTKPDGRQKNARFLESVCKKTWPPKRTLSQSRVRKHSIPTMKLGTMKVHSGSFRNFYTAKTDKKQ